MRRSCYIQNIDIDNNGKSLACLRYSQLGLVGLGTRLVRSQCQYLQVLRSPSNILCPALDKLAMIVVQYDELISVDVLSHFGKITFVHLYNVLDDEYGSH